MASAVKRNPENTALAAAMVVVFLTLASEARAADAGTPPGDGGAKVDPPVSAERKAFAADIEEMMIEHYMKAYFPKIIDRKDGGVYMCFNRQFNPTFPCTKNLDMESRHLFSSSMASIEVANYPELYGPYPGLREAADSIYAYIRDELWDKTDGGSGFFAGGSGGQVGPTCPKPVYHNGFALVGLSAYYLATRNEEALKIAISTWKWIESKAYDPEFGMYYGWLDGKGNLTNGKGKNQDILHHWIEGMAWLYIAWPPGRADAADRELLRKRVKESADLFTSNKWIRGDGSIILDNNREMTSGGSVNNGLDAEDVYLFYFYYTAIDTVPPPAAIANLKRVHEYVESKSNAGEHFASQWWPDAELFTSYCSMAVNYDAGDSHLAECKKHWEFIKANYFDPQYGGWYREPGATNSLKGDDWECTYHGFKCMLFARNLVLGSQKAWIDPRIPVPGRPGLDGGVGSRAGGGVGGGDANVAFDASGRGGAGGGAGADGQGGGVGGRSGSGGSSAPLSVKTADAADCTCALGTPHRRGGSSLGFFVVALYFLVRRSGLRARR